MKFKFWPVLIFLTLCAIVCLAPTVQMKTSTGTVGTVPYWTNGPFLSQTSPLSIDGTNVANSGGLNFVGSSFITLAPPTPPNAPTVVDGAAGTIAAGTYNYRASWVGPSIGTDSNREETELGIVSANWVADGAHQALITRSVILPPPALATGWKLYRSKTGPTTSWFELSGTIPLATLTYSDDAADASFTLDAFELSSTFGRRMYADGLVASVLGTYNTAYGLYALRSNTIGAFNSAFGRGSMSENTTGGFNTALGGDALKRNISGIRNVAVGVDALMANVTGEENVAVGSSALIANTVGVGNVAAGKGALGTGTSGSVNVGVGYTALGFANANFNAAFGTYAGRSIISGGNNTFIGSSSGFHANQKIDATNSIAIGADTFTTTNNQMVLGGSNITTTVMRGIVGIAGGISSTLSNLVAPTSITFPATTVPWTNTFGINIEIYIDNFAVTGSVLTKNGGQIASGITQFMTFGLQPGEYFAETYTVGTPTAKWSPR